MCQRAVHDCIYISDSALLCGVNQKSGPGSADQNLRLASEWDHDQAHVQQPCLPSLACSEIYIICRDRVGPVIIGYCCSRAADIKSAELLRCSDVMLRARLFSSFFSPAFFRRRLMALRSESMYVSYLMISVWRYRLRAFQFSRDFTRFLVPGENLYQRILQAALTCRIIGSSSALC